MLLSLEYLLIVLFRIKLIVKITEIESIFQGTSAKAFLSNRRTLKVPYDFLPKKHVLLTLFLLTNWAPFVQTFSLQFNFRVSIRSASRVPLRRRQVDLNKEKKKGCKWCPTYVHIWSVDVIVVGILENHSWSIHWKDKISIGQITHA